MTTKYKFFLLLFLFSCSLHAQVVDDKWRIGFKAGATYSTFSDLSQTIIRPGLYTGYTTEDQFRFGFTGGIMAFYKFQRSFLAVQPEFTFSMQGNNFSYSDSLGLEYDMKFPYQYINFAVLTKFYPIAGLHLMAGPQIGFNIASNNISYTSNDPEVGLDLQVQQSLREVLKGRSDFSVAFGLGYEFKDDFPLVLEARFNMGLTDVMETLANGFNFIENPNKSMFFQFTVGYTVPFRE